MSTMTKHFVEFYWPGSFVANTSDREVESWDVDAALEMVRDMDRTPYAFRFFTRARGPDDLDSHVTKRSPFYHLGGTIETLADVEARDPGSILASNMQMNGYERVITNTNSWRWTSVLEKDDVVLPWDTLATRQA